MYNDFMDINKIILIGRVGQDPEIRNLPNGGLVCTLTIVTEMFYTNKEGKKTTKAEWHKVVTFDQAIITYCQERVNVGDTLYIEGRLTYRTIEPTDSTAGKKIKLAEIHVSKYNGTISMFKKKRAEGDFGEIDSDSETESNGESSKKKRKAEEDADEIPFDI